MASIDTERLLKAITDYGKKVMEEHSEAKTADEAEEKIDSGNIDHLDVKSLGMIKIMINMIRDVYAKKYQVPPSTMVLIVGAIAYLVLPLDLIPDWFPGIGHSDDAAVIALIVKKCYDDLVAYDKWKKEQGEAVDVDASEVEQAEGKASDVEADKSDVMSLDEYLSKNFGDNEELKKAEIERLAALCYDESVTDLRKRAEIALADLA